MGINSIYAYFVDTFIYNSAIYSNVFIRTWIW